MKLFAAFPIVLAQAGSYATMVLGNVRELCYRDLQDSCAVYHINGSYADAYNRLYLSDALMVEDPVVTTAAQDLNMKLEKWMPFVDHLSRAQVGPELHNMQQDILPALVNATASQPEPQRDQATSKEMRDQCYLHRRDCSLRRRTRGSGDGRRNYRRWCSVHRRAAYWLRND
jgi:hypothetical protein